VTTPGGPALHGNAGRRVQALLDDLQIDQDGDLWQLLPFLLATQELPLAGLIATGNGGNPGVAAERNGVQLLNPAGSGVDVYVMAIWGRGDLAAQETTILLQLSDVSLDTPINSTRRFLDTFHGAQEPVCQMHLETDWTVVGVRAEQTTVLLDTNYYSQIAPHVILRPGRGIVTTPSAVDEDQFVNYLWREAPARR